MSRQKLSIMYPLVLLLTILALVSAPAFSSRKPVKASSESSAEPQKAVLQNSDLEMSAYAAFDGYFKYGEWLPIWVELENKGSDLDATLRIQISGSQNILVFETPISLPTGSHKRVAVHVLPNNFSRELEVHLVQDDTALATQKVTVRPQPNITFFTGLVTADRGALALLNGVELGGQDRQKVLVDLTVADLPERAEGLRAFDLLVFNDIDTTSLSPEQVSALSSWVQQGGLLVIGGGAGAQRTMAGIPENLSPFLVRRTSTIKGADLDALASFAGGEPIVTSGPFVIAGGDIVDAQISSGSNDLPILIERSVGSGAVIFSTLDLASAPFNGWPGTQVFWQNLIGSRGIYPDYMPFDISPRQYRANNLYFALSNIPSLDLPSVKNISILLIVYILIVGPVNYLVLRRLKRMHWAWITIPTLTLLFTAAAFGIGYGLRGNDLILNKIALIETRKDGNASVTSYMGLFSPRLEAYEVSVEGENLISPMTGYDTNVWGGSPTSGGEMVFVQGQTSTVRGLSVNQWAMQSFMSESAWQDFGDFSGKLRIENEALVGTIRNDTSQTLTDVVVAMKSRFARLGDMAPGEEKPVDVGLSNLQNERFGSPLSYRLFQENLAGGPLPRDLEQKTNILNSVFETGYWSKFSSSFSPAAQNKDTTGDIVVFGWLDQAPPAVQVPNNTLTQKTTALVYTYMDYNLPENGYLTLPAGLIPGAIVAIPVNSGTCGTSTSLQMTTGTAEFNFQAPDAIRGFQIDTLKLVLYRDNSNMGEKPDISLYNWNNESWTKIQDPIQGTNIIENADPYVDKNGLVRIQLTTENDNSGCIYLDLGLEAAKAAGQGG